LKIGYFSRVRGARRPVAVDSPLLSKTSNAGRTSAGADSPDVREGSRDRDVKSRQSADVAPRSVSGVVTDVFGGTWTQTPFSIQNPLFSGGEGDVVSSRKSSRSERRSASTTSSAPASSCRSAVATQTDDVKVGIDEKVVVGWPRSDAKILPSSTTTLAVPKAETEVLKTAHCKTDQSSRIVSWDSVLDGSYDKRTSETLKGSEERINTWEPCGFDNVEA
ncbi:hypothetical protein TELCIR_06552, partial [Teladorsagia circumcincta]